MCHLLKVPVLRTTGLELPVFLALIYLKPLKNKGCAQRGVCIFFGAGCSFQRLKLILGMKKFSDLWISTNKYKQPNTNEKTATIKYNVRYIKYAQMKDQLNKFQC